MDLDEEAVRSLRGCRSHRPCKAREVGLIFNSEDPRLVRVMAIRATERPSRAALNVPERRGKFTKDVEFNRTNRRSPLASTKVPENRTQKMSKRGRKTCQEYARKLKQTERATPRGQIKGVPAKRASCCVPFSPRRESSFCPTLRWESAPAAED